MARLPVVGGDSGNWGAILNGFLEVSLNGDGTIQPAALLAAGGVTSVNTIAPNANGAVTLTPANIGAYAKPSTGIPSTDLSSAVQADLTAASSAVQLGGDLGGTNTSPIVTKLQGTSVNAANPTTNQVLSYVGGQWVPATVTSTTVNDATSSSPGIVQLDGDLGGTATSPEVVGIKGVALPASAPVANQVLTATSGSATAWSTPAAGVQLDTSASDIQPDTTTGTAVAGSIGKAADAGHQHSLVSHDHTTANKGSQIPVGGLSATGTASSTTYLRGDGSWSTPPTAGNATSSATGLIQLDGDLGGSATSPQVVGTNLAAPLPVSQGGTGSASQNFLTLGGDLAGSVSSPTVESIQGVAVSGTPSSGQALIASSSSAAGWSAVAGATDWLNVKNYGATGNGATDDTTAIQATFAAASSGQTVYFPAENYFMNSSTAITMAVDGISVLGDGPYATTITVGPSFSAAYLFDVAQSDCSISRLYLNGPGASATNNFNAIEVGNNLSRIRLSDLYLTNIPGWCIESISGSGTNSDHMYRSINARGNAGGIHLQGSGGSHRECFITDVNCQQQGSGVGLAANLDTFLFQDVSDVLCVNFNSGQTSGGAGSAIHVLGACASLDFVNMDISASVNSSQKAVVTVEQGTNGKPSGISFWGCSCQDGYIGAAIGTSGTDQTQKVRFYNSGFSNNSTHGTTVQGTGIEITFLSCEWTGNGTSAAGNNYDINWQNTGDGRVEFSHFASVPVASGTSGVQANVSLPSNNSSAVSFWNNVMHNSGIAESTIFANGNYPNMFFLAGNSTPTYFGQLLVQSPFGAPSLPNFRVTSADAGDNAFGLDVSGDNYRRLAVNSNGELQWGSGSVTQDTSLYRSAANTLATGNSFTAGTSISSPLIISSGSTGATAASRYAGATTSGHPTSGTFATGDFVVDQTGALWICTDPGTPGTWAEVSGGVVLDSTVTDIAQPGTQAAGSIGKAADAGHVHPANQSWLPGDSGLLAWNYDPGLASNTGTAASGTIYLMRVNVRAQLSATNACVFLSTAGSGLTSGENFAGLYNSSGNLVASTADQSANWAGSAGRLYTMALSGGPYTISSGTYWVALLSNGTTPATFARWGAATSNLTNLGAGTNSRSATNGTGTSLPSSVTLASNSSNNTMYWVALS
jgi:hypothetical protein